LLYEYYQKNRFFRFALRLLRRGEQSTGLRQGAAEMFLRVWAADWQYDVRDKYLAARVL
jgi:hypothetical protein